MKCSHCDNEPTQVGRFWVCPEHGPIGSERPAEALRIFLSYGHDDNEDLVRRIKGDLEARGHFVWFDKSPEEGKGIRAGDDWRRAITEGIAKCQKFVSFLSKHSTRDPGVCRDEIAIAIGVKGGNIQTILVESEQEVQAPVNIGHIQWLDMHDWKVQRAAGAAEWEQWYQAKFTEILRVVESEESRRFAGEIEKLNEHLKPIKSEARICQLLSKGFYGRAWLFDAVEKWRHDANNTSRLFWIMGDPGVGKSAFAAQLTHTRSDAVIAAQFVQWNDNEHRDARRVIRSIAFQLATRLPDYRKLLLTLPEIADLDRKNADDLFDYLLANPLRPAIDGGREKYVIVIDALDEAGEAGRNTLVEMLARQAPRLPDWLGIVVTSRPESDVKSPLQGLNPSVLDTRTEANRADLREYLRQKLASQLTDRADADRLVERILEKSEGVFLYVERFCDEVQQNHLSLDRPEQFPQGLGGIFCEWFQRQFPDLEKFRQDVRPALRAILAAREPLPVEILQRLFNWKDEELRDFTRTLGSLFPVAKETNGEVIKPYHKSLADWLTDQAKAGMFFVSLIEGHRLLADYRLAELRSREALNESLAASSYWSRRLVHHCYAPQDWKKVISCIAEQRVFQSLWPGSYDCIPLLSSYDSSPVHSNATNTLGFYRGDFSSVQTDPLTPAVFGPLTDEMRIEACWALATAFADRTRDRQLAGFSYARKFGQGSNTIRNFLKESNPTVFLEYRDVVYSFVALSGIAPEYAIATYGRDDGFEEKAKQFLEKYRSIHSYLGYLASFACTEGWSGQLESEADASLDTWKKLEALAQGKSAASLSKTYLRES